MCGSGRVKELRSRLISQWQQLRTSSSTSNNPPFKFWVFYSLAILSRYCRVAGIDPYHRLKKPPAGRINNFFRWICNEYTVLKTSSVTTYWHQLRQVYIKYKGRRASPLVLKKVYLHRCPPRQKSTVLHAIHPSSC